MKEKELTKKEVNYYKKTIDNAKKEISRVVVGQEEIINAVFAGLLSNGHILLEGVPGIAKTLIVRSFADISKATFSRIQFTADLLPSDLTGVTSYEKEKGFYVLKGPLFANFVLGDEINRSPPKVQSALLEAMQERQTTIGKETYKMPSPFLVLATQNPIESLGTYALPAAQVDRFLFKLEITYPKKDEERVILDQNITLHDLSDYRLKPLLPTKLILEMQEIVKHVYLNEEIEKYIVNIVNATRYPKKYHINLGKYIWWGASPRASIGMYIASKAMALLEGKTFVTPHDVQQVAHDVIRHRLILNYEGIAEEIKVDDIITEILSKVPVP